MRFFLASREAHVNSVIVFLGLWKFVQKMGSSASSDCEVRAVIKFLNVEGVTGSEIHQKLSNVYGAGTNQPKR